MKNSKSSSHLSNLPYYIIIMQCNTKLYKKTLPIERKLATKFINTWQAKTKGANVDISV